MIWGVNIRPLCLFPILLWRLYFCDANAWSDVNMLVSNRLINNFYLFSKKSKEIEANSLFLSIDGTTIFSWSIKKERNQYVYDSVYIIHRLSKCIFRPTQFFYQFVQCNGFNSRREKSKCRSDNAKHSLLLLILSYTKRKSVELDLTCRSITA